MLESLTTRLPNAWLHSGAVPVYSPRHADDRAADFYDRDTQSADYYSAVAFGHRPAVWDLADRWGRGEAEGLYRTIASYVLELGCGKPRGLALDAGCGVGRTVRDCAPAMPGWTFVASDYAYHMCERAYEVLRAGQAITLASLARRGFLTATLPALHPLENAVVAQASVLDLPFRDALFDCVTATLLVDRVADPPVAIQELARMLAPEGRLIVSTPLSFRDPDAWISRDGVVDLMRDAGLRVIAAFDGLVYREVKDQRGNWDEWRVAVMVAGRE